ncbi:MAG: site-specific DNA-methyltransferase [Ignavibacteria bacterium]|jgi:site-specific DNA-methyltransferase (adenine-specific)|nr:site-specific DNA-methyltransferase [Ignavibacteria bacterium]
MNDNYLNKIINDDCLNHLSNLEESSIDLFLSDIPYGICLDDWDVLHNNTNSALLGTSPAQNGKNGFKRRGKPINGWSSADRNIGKEYQEWVQKWSDMVFPIMKEGAFQFVFGARRTIHRVVNAFENSGFLLKDILAWKKPSAHHRAQKFTNILRNRGLEEELEVWNGWRLGNLAPIYEPIAWFFKPYKITITDNILKHGVGAINTEECKINGSNPTNLLEFGFSKNENKLHEAQKPLELIEFLIKLTTRENQIVLDPFIGSGTTALAAKRLKRNFIGFEINEGYCNTAIERVDDKAAFPHFYELEKEHILF